MIRLAIGLLLGFSLGYASLKTGGYAGLWWLLIGVITGGVARSLDLELDKLKNKIS